MIFQLSSRMCPHHEPWSWGQENIEFLTERYAADVTEPAVRRMQFTEDARTIAEWMPLVMAGRDATQRP